MKTIVVDFWLTSTKTVPIITLVLKNIELFFVRTTLRWRSIFLGFRFLGSDLFEESIGVAGLYCSFAHMTARRSCVSLRFYVVRVTWEHVNRFYFVSWNFIFSYFACAVTLVDRRSQFLMIGKSSSKKALPVCSVMAKMLRNYPHLSITPQS